MKYLLRLCLVASIVLLTGCYHARVTTGEDPSNQVIDRPFVSSWIYGLVPPEPVDAAEECDGGVAIVETQLSFVNQLVGFITFGIYTPMHITVTCATGGTASLSLPEQATVPAGATEAEAAEAVQSAARVSAETKQVVAVRFE